MIKVRACSKLFLSGEYAVVHNEGQAIVLSIPLYTDVEIFPADTCTIYSDIFGYRINLIEKEHNYQLILDCIFFFAKYLKQLNRSLKLFHLKISSELYNENKKYGLGSSGSVVVAVFRALLLFHNIQLSDLDIFKLIAIFLVKRSYNGSLADIACITFDNNIYFRQFDRSFILKDDNIVELLKNDFNSLQITKYRMPSNIKMLVVWSGITADSSKLVTEVNINDYFISNSNKITQKLLHGNQNDFYQCIPQLRTLLQQLSPQIEIETLRDICDIACNNRAVAKSSGAGGGDCVTIFYNNDSDTPTIKNKLKHPIILEVNYE